MSARNRNKTYRKTREKTCMCGLACMNVMTGCGSLRHIYSRGLLSESCRNCRTNETGSIRNPVIEARQIFSYLKSDILVSTKLYFSKQYLMLFVLSLLTHLSATSSKIPRRRPRCSR